MVALPWKLPTEAEQARLEAARVAALTPDERVRLIDELNAACEALASAFDPAGAERRRSVARRYEEESRDFWRRFLRAAAYGTGSGTRP